MVLYTAAVELRQDALCEQRPGVGASRYPKPYHYQLPASSDHYAVQLRFCTPCHFPLRRQSLCRPPKPQARPQHNPTARHNHQNIILNAPRNSRSLHQINSTASHIVIYKFGEFWSTARVLFDTGHVAVDSAATAEFSLHSPPACCCHQGFAPGVALVRLDRLPAHSHREASDIARL